MQHGRRDELNHLTKKRIKCIKSAFASMSRNCRLWTLSCCILKRTFHGAFGSTDVNLLLRMAQPLVNRLRLAIYRRLTACITERFVPMSADVTTAFRQVRHQFLLELGVKDHVNHANVNGEVDVNFLAINSRAICNAPGGHRVRRIY